MPNIAPKLDPEYFKALCPTCGRRFLAHEIGKRGKPRGYCNPDCAAAKRAWDAFNLAFGRVISRLTIPSLFEWRGDLLGAASERAWNKGVSSKLTRAEAEADEKAADEAALAAAIAVARAKLVKKNPRRGRKPIRRPAARRRALR